jgi:2-methylisocitrate lyase-like PEP mutase family enzyme
VFGLGVSNALALNAYREHQQRRETMTDRIAQARRAFRKLHDDGIFLLPNPWDIGSAKVFAHQGFKALASTSTGLAWTLGKPDYVITMEEVLTHLKALSDATSLPVNADFESGFANDPEGVATNVARAIETGVAGISIEDRKVGDLDTLFDDRTAGDRIKAAKQAILSSGEDVVLVGRTERLLIDPSAVSQSIDTLVALAEAGADCLYAPGLNGRANIEAAIKALSPKPLNVLTMGPKMPGVTYDELKQLGVRRVSVGGALSLVGWGAIERAGEALLSGKFEVLAEGMPRADLNRIFAG